MNQLHLGLRLGSNSPQVFRRTHNETLIASLAHQPNTSFVSTKPGATSSFASGASERDGQEVAHKAGVNCLAIDNNAGQYLASGGADATIRLWDLDAQPSST